VSDDVPLAQPAADSLTGGSNVLSAKQRRRHNRLDRWRTSVDEAFVLLTQQYPKSRVEPVLSRLLDTHPTVGRLHLLVGRYHRRNGSLAVARHHLQRAVELTPNSTPAHLETGGVATTQGDTTTAIRAYRRAFALDPSAPGAATALIRLYDAQGRLGALIQRWRRQYESRPVEALRDPLIEALHKAGRYQEAQNIVETAAESGS